MRHRPESLFVGKDSRALALLFGFHAPWARNVVDVTCNARKMWRGYRPPFTPRFYDADPAVKPDVTCRWDALPDADGSVDVIVFDPPHLPRTTAKAKLGKRFGLLEATHKGEMDFFRPFLAEARRVLIPDGLVFAKVKDYVFDHEYRWNLSRLVGDCRAEALTPCDLLVTVPPTRGVEGGNWQHAHHFRNSHCYWVVLRKGACEPKRQTRPPRGRTKKPAGLGAWA